MTFDLQKIIEGKRKLRREMAELPIGEKLRWLDVLHQRQLDIQNAKPVDDSGVESKEIKE